jgi:hypothetical protein
MAAGEPEPLPAVEPAGDGRGGVAGQRGRARLVALAVEHADRAAGGVRSAELPAVRIIVKRTAKSPWPDVFLRCAVTVREREVGRRPGMVGGAYRRRCRTVAALPIPEAVRLLDELEPAGSLVSATGPVQ